MFGLFERDAGAICAAELDCRIDQLLQDRLGLLREEAGEAAQGDRLPIGVALLLLAVLEPLIGEEIPEVHAGVELGAFRLHGRLFGGTK